MIAEQVVSPAMQIPHIKLLLSFVSLEEEN